METETERCECTGCGCDQPATMTDDVGAHVCGECVDYYCDGGGAVICSRMQSTGVCRHCGQWIEWSRIYTGGPGVANWREGRCACRGWRETEAGRGNAWRISELDEADDHAARLNAPEVRP